MENLEKLETLGIQDEAAINNGQSRETEGAIKNGQSRETEGAIKNGQSRETSNTGYTRRRGHQEWTIQRNWQHWVYKTKEQSRMDNLEKTEGAIKRKQKGQSRIDNPEKLATLGIQDEVAIKNGQSRENRRGNQE